MLTASKLWREKQSPLWLLLVSRSKACYPRKRGSVADVASYVAQFSHGILPDIKDRQFGEKVHPGHKDFFELLAKEATAYYDVFYDRHSNTYDSYTGELVEQFNKAYGPQHIVSLYRWEIYENPQVVGNMMVAVAMAAIRDMALVEDMHRQGKLTEAEYLFGLKEINGQMDRVGINGIDRLFESKPDLEEFVKHDIRVISTEHMTHHYRDEKTRAAAYNVNKLDYDKFNLGKDSLTHLRQQIIAPDFVEIEEEKDHIIQIHVHELEAPTDSVRHKYARYGALHGYSSASTTESLKKAEGQIGGHSFGGSEEFLNFLIHDGIAMNHPQRHAYADKMRKQMKEANTGPKVELVEPGTHIDAQDGTPDSEKVTETQLVLVKSPRSPAKKKEEIEEAEIIEEIKNPIDPKKKDEVIVVDAISDVDNKKDMHSETKADKPVFNSNIGAKVATLGGAAVFTGLLLSNNKQKEQEQRDGEGIDSQRRMQPQKSFKTKPIVFGAAAVVTVGGAIMWSKKPEFLYKPLRELLEKVVTLSGKAK